MSKKFGGSTPSPWSTHEQDALDSVNGFSGSQWGTHTSPKKAAPRCYESHPPLPLVDAVGTYNIYGGSCSDPVVLDADIYIGFDYMRAKHFQYPWNPATSTVIEIAFPITDMRAPSNPEEFKKMITWVCNQLREGKKIHAGCIGGHGRTGTFLAAVVAEFTGEKDAITYVRANYCKKAVESVEQIKFLGAHYGILPVQGSKADLFSGSSKWSSAPPAKASAPSGAWKTSLGSKSSNVVALPSANKLAFSGASRVIAPVPNSSCIWNKRLDKPMC